MDRQSIAQIKNSYIQNLIDRKEFLEAGEVASRNIYDPIFKNKFIHPEGIPRPEQDINIQIEQIRLDSSLLYSEFAFNAIDISQYMATVKSELMDIQNIIKSELQYKQDLELLTNNYSEFAIAKDLYPEDFNGNFYTDGTLMAATIESSSDIAIEIESIDGNGYEGNAHVLTTDNKFLSTIVDTSKRSNITDQNDNTMYEYSRITASPTEPKIYSDVNIDSNEAFCSIVLKSGQEFSAIQFNTNLTPAVIKAVYTSTDGVHFNPISKRTIDIYNINKESIVLNYLPMSGIICFPATKYLKIDIESSVTTTESLAFEVLEEKQENITIKETILKSMKLVPTDYIINIILEQTLSDISLINNNNIYIIDKYDNSRVPVTMDYNNSTKLLQISATSSFAYSKQYELTVQNLQNTSTTKSIIRLDFDTIDQTKIDLTPKFFIDPSQSLEVNVPIAIHSNYINDSYIYMVNNNYQLIDASVSVGESNSYFYIKARDISSVNNDEVYTIYIRKGIITTDGEPTNEGYSLQFKTINNDIAYREKMFILGDSIITIDCGLNIDQSNLNSDYIYIIDNNNEKLSSSITKDGTVLTIDPAIDFNTDFKIIVENGTLLTDGSKTTKEECYEFAIKEYNSVQLTDNIFIDYQKTKLTISATLDFKIVPSYVSNNYIYIVNSAGLKLNMNLVSETNALGKSTIKAEANGLFGALEDYYLIIDKSTNIVPLNSKEIKSLGSNYIKRVRTKDPAAIELETRYFISPDIEPIILNKTYDQIFIIDKDNKPMLFNLEELEEKTYITFTKLMKSTSQGISTVDASQALVKPKLIRNSTYKIIGEGENTEIITIKTEPATNTIKSQSNKYFLPTSYTKQVTSVYPLSFVTIGSAEDALSNQVMILKDNIKTPCTLNILSETLKVAKISKGVSFSISMGLENGEEYSMLYPINVGTDKAPVINIARVLCTTRTASAVLFAQKETGVD